MKELSTNKYETHRYEAPIIEIIEVEVEKGFATSSLFYGNEGSAGGNITKDDIIMGGDF